MRTLYHQLKKQTPLFVAGIFALLAASCSSSQSAYESDGIYASESQNMAAAEEDSKSSYYRQYFQSKDKTFEEVPEEGAVFTNIEAYSSNESLDEDGNIIIEEPAYTEGYGAWGTNSENVTVAIINYSQGANIDSLDVSYEINGGGPITESVIALLFRPPFSRALYIFLNTALFSRML